MLPSGSSRNMPPRKPAPFSSTSIRLIASRELEYALNHSGVSVLIASRTFRKTDYLQLLLELAPDFTESREGPFALRSLPQLCVTSS